MQPDAPTPPDPRGAATPGPYLCERRTVYALHEGAVRAGLHGRKPTMVNRWSALVQPHPGCTEAEAEAVAALFASAPALRDALAGAEAAMADMLAGWRYVREHHGDLYGVGWDRAEKAVTEARDAARFALASAEGGQP